MPTVLDATVVNSAYDTSGNGGRKLVQLSNGWLFAVAKNGTTAFHMRKSVDNGTNWSQVVGQGVTGLVDVAIATDGGKIFALRSDSSSVIGSVYDSSGNLLAGPNSIDSGQTAVGNVSLAINEAGTGGWGAWASKNSTYSNSFNIRAASFTINADGSVTWGAVEQATIANSNGVDYKNPSIIIKDNIPYIFFDHSMANKAIGFVAKHSATGTSYYHYGTGWYGNRIYDSSSYAQSSPSAIFVPQSVNGLANGRIWVAWHGTDSTDPNYENIRVSYSDDGGVTWSVMQKLTSGNIYRKYRASITANKNNEIFVLFSGVESGNEDFNVYKIKNSGGVWGSISNVTNFADTDTTTEASAVWPSALFDLSVNFTEPLFIYQGESKVGFYGTWTTTQISVPPGHLGAKSDRSNLLSYAITTDDTMSPITEKVNGVTVGTKTATSGEVLIAGLTQEQWDAVRFGRYADATGGKNTLTVEMGSEKWTYTFDKALTANPDLITEAKALEDAATVSLPAKKALLASAIRSKGGSVSDDAAFEAMAQAVGGIEIPNIASGTVTSSASTMQFQYLNSTSAFNAYYIEVTGLGFKPEFIIAYAENGAATTTYRPGSGGYTDMCIMINATTTGTGYVFKAQYGGYVNETGFKIPVLGSGNTWNWIVL